MDFSNPGITYALFVIPVLFALTMTGQGIMKLIRQEDGGAGLGFGIVCLLLVGATYLFFIR